MPALVRVTNVKEESFACQREILILSRRRLLFQQFGGAIHYSDCHSPTAPPATCPPDQPSVPVSCSGHRPACPLAKTPCERSPSLDKASFLQSPPAPDSLCDVCLAHRHLVLCTEERVRHRGMRALGTWSETGGAESGEVGHGGHQHDAARWRWWWQPCVLDVAGTANPFSSGRGTTFPGTKICSRSPRCHDRNEQCCSHTCVLLCWGLLSCPSAEPGPSTTCGPVASASWAPAAEARQSCMCVDVADHRSCGTGPGPVFPLGAGVFPKEGWAALSRKEFRKSKLVSCSLAPWLGRD